MRRTILRSELLRFSHYVPAFRLTSERGGAPRGYYELDSAVVSRIKRQEQDASMEGVEFETTKKKAEESKTSKKKREEDEEDEEIQNLHWGSIPLSIW